MSKAARAKAKAELKAKKKAADIEKKRGYEYGSWNLFVLINQLLGIHKLIPEEVVTRYTQAKIAKGLKYNEGMGSSNLLKMVLSIICRKHEKGVIADIKQFACEDAAVDKLAASSSNSPAAKRCRVPRLGTQLSSRFNLFVRHH